MVKLENGRPRPNEGSWRLKRKGTALAALLQLVRQKEFTSRYRQRQRVKPWFAINGDRTLRLDYPLTAESIVFDVGGFEGNWAAEIYDRYGCTVHIFEPVVTFHAGIVARFASNPKIHVWPFGLASVDGDLAIGLAGDSSSIHRKIGAETEIAQLRSFAGFLDERRIKHIDLLKINIEGGEYELLEHILNMSLAGSITDIQVQFHDFIPDASRRMRAIQGRLAATHSLTYQYEFVWENWRLRREALAGSE